MATKKEFGNTQLLLHQQVFAIGFSNVIGIQIGFELMTTNYVLHSTKIADQIIHRVFKKSSRKLTLVWDYFQRGNFPISEQSRFYYIRKTPLRFSVQNSNEAH